MDAVLSPHIPPGLIANRYQRLEVLDRGGMGVVYRAEDRLSSPAQYVALKQIPIAWEVADSVDPSRPTAPQNALRESLVQEFRILASLRHPNIISVLDYGLDSLIDGQPFFTMELLTEAEHFTAYAARQSPEEKIRLLAQVLYALDYLHRCGILHRDLKPSNIQVVNGIVKVLDFGLAITLHQREAAALDAQGTVGYVAPEVLLHQQFSEASDLYAVGVIAFELFAGRHPFPQGELPPGDGTAAAPDPDALTLPADYEGLRGIILRLLDPDPQARYASTQTVLKALGAATPVEIRETPESRESRLTAAPFIGREDEAKQLKAALTALKRVESSPARGSAWLVGGESGLGKTRLLDEIETFAKLESVDVLRGKAVQSPPRPFDLWSDILSRLALSVTFSDDETAVLDEIVYGRQPSNPGSNWPTRVQGRITDVFKKVERPLVLILDDLHWLKPDDVNVLSSIIRSLSTRPIMVLGSYSREESPDLPNRLAAAKVIQLPRLDEGGIRALSKAVLGEEATTPVVVGYLDRLSEGNPFFLVAALRELVDKSPQEIAQGIGLSADQMPPSIKEVLQRRLKKLPDPARDLIRLAATAGHTLDQKLLTTALDPQVHETEVETRLMGAAEVSVLTEREGKYAFAHDRLPGLVLEDLPKTERARLHRRVAEAIVAVYPNDESHTPELARHWLEAADVDQAVPAALRAADWLNLRAQWSDALDLVRKALDALNTTRTAEPDAAGMRLRIKAGMLNLHLADYDMARRMLYEAQQVADRRGDFAAQAQIQDYVGQALAYQQSYAEAQRHMEQALDLYARAGDAAPKHLADARFNLGLVHLRLGRVEEGKAHIERSLGEYRAIPLRHGEARALQYLGQIADDLDTAREHYERSLTICKEIGDLLGESSTENDLGFLEEQAGDYPRAATHFEASLDITRRLNHRLSIANTLVNLGFLYLRLGRLDEAHQALMEGLKIADEINAAALLLEALVGFAWYDALRGIPEEGATLAGAIRHEPHNSDVTLRLEGLHEVLVNALGEAETVRLYEDGRRRNLSAVFERLLGE